MPSKQPYEGQDVQPSQVFWPLLILTVITIVCVFACLWMLNAMNNTPDDSAVAQTPLAAVRVVPPSPVLQPDPPMEMDAYMAGQEDQLHNYGWVNKEAGTVHIPIDEAIALVAKRGINRPVVAAPSEAESDPSK